MGIFQKVKADNYVVCMVLLDKWTLDFEMDFELHIAFSIGNKLLSYFAIIPIFL